MTLIIPDREQIASGTRVIRLDVAELVIPLAQIGRYAGGSHYKMDLKSQVMAQNALECVRNHARPAFGYALVSAAPEASGEIVGLASGYRLELPDQERDPEIGGVAAAACTLGPDLDQTIRELAAGGDLAQSLFVDAAGVALLEAVGAACREHIQQVIKPLKLYCGCPFGPGYGATPMGSLSALLGHLDSKALGVDLPGETMMRPLKSVAFWLRLTCSRKALESSAYKCRRCGMEHCQFRATDARRPVTGPQGMVRRSS